MPPCCRADAASVAVELRQIELRFCHPLQSGLLEPAGGFPEVLLHTLALHIHHAQTVLGIGVAFESSLLIPVQRLRGIPFDALTFAVHAGEQELCPQMTLFGCERIPVLGKDRLLVHLFPFGVQRSEDVLRFGVTLLRSLAEESHRLAVILGHDKPEHVQESERTLGCRLFQGRLLEPEDSLVHVDGHPVAPGADSYHPMLRVDNALLGRDPDPVGGAFAITRNPIALRKHQTELVACLGMTLLGSLLEKAHRLVKILVDTLAVQIGHAKRVPRLDGAALDCTLVCERSLMTVLGNAEADSVQQTQRKVTFRIALLDGALEPVDRVGIVVQ